MKINLDLTALEANEFDLRMGKIAGETVVLVNPRGFPKWTKDLLIFRSSVWTMDGTLISAGFKKFFNLTEAPHIVPDPTDADIAQGEFLEKLDGSLLIVSKYKGELIVRTRGTLDATALDNGHEVAILKQKYPKCFSNIFLDAGYTLLFEWLSDTNKIILTYPDCPDMKLVGMISHEDYKYASQMALDQLAKDLNVGRPRRFAFKSIGDMLSAVEALKDQEGYCFYYNDEQDIKKVKSPWYLALHRFKSNCSLEYILDFYVECGQPDYQTFVDKITQTFDHECLALALPFASQVVDAGRQVRAILAGMQTFVDTKLKPLGSRKEQAQLVISSYGKTNRSGFVFSLLDGKVLDKDAIKKLYWQALKS